MERTRGRNAGPRSSNSEMEGRKGEEGGRECSLVAHGDREGLLMDGPWLLIRSDLWWGRTFRPVKCWSGLSGTIVLRFSRRGTAEVLLGTTGSNQCFLSQDKLIPSLSERRAEVRRSRRENAKWGINQSGLHSFFFSHFRTSLRPNSTERI